MLVLTYNGKNIRFDTTTKMLSLADLSKALLPSSKSRNFSNFMKTKEAKRLVQALQERFPEQKVFERRSRSIGGVESWASIRLVLGYIRYAEEEFKTWFEDTVLPLGAPQQKVPPIEKAKTNTYNIVNNTTGKLLFTVKVHAEDVGMHFNVNQPSKEAQEVVPTYAQVNLKPTKNPKPPAQTDMTKKARKGKDAQATPTVFDTFYYRLEVWAKTDVSEHTFDSEDLKVHKALKQKRVMMELTHYRCFGCGAVNCKLWCSEPTGNELYCVYCAGKKLGIAITDLDKDGRRKDGSCCLGRGDMQFWPVIPNESSIHRTWWSVDSQEWQWWRSQPNFTKYLPNGSEYNLKRKEFRKRYERIWTNCEDIQGVVIPPNLDETWELVTYSWGPDEQWIVLWQRETW